MKIKTRDFKVRPAGELKLSDRPTKVDSLFKSKKQYHIGIFNRSYYEEVLIVRVHPELLRGQKLPAGSIAGQAIWEERYRSIVDLEAHLHRNGTRIIKFFR